MERMMQIFSKELEEMDKNTVQYIFDLTPEKANAYFANVAES